MRSYTYIIRVQEQDHGGWWGELRQSVSILSTSPNNAILAQVSGPSRESVLAALTDGESFLDEGDFTNA